MLIVTNVYRFVTKNALFVIHFASVNIENYFNESSLDTIINKKLDLHSNSLCPINIWVFRQKVNNAITVFRLIPRQSAGVVSNYYKLVSNASDQICKLFLEQLVIAV